MSFLDMEPICKPLDPIFSFGPVGLFVFRVFLDLDPSEKSPSNIAMLLVLVLILDRILGTKKEY